MKNSFFFLLLCATFFVGCKNDTAELLPQEVSKETEQMEARLIYCPRADFTLSQITDMHDFADELADVMNCGRYIRLPDCSESDYYTDSGTVLIDEWCSSFTSGCLCNDLPGSFTIAEQDLLIAEATSQLDAALGVCGLDNASFSWYVTITQVPTCEDIVIKLYAEASAVCCSNTF